MKKRARGRARSSVFEDDDLEIKMRARVMLEKDRIQRVAHERARRKELAYRKRLDRKRLMEATTPADSIVIRMMNDIELARRTEKEVWKRLARYLVTGEDCEPRVRIRVPQ